LLEKFRDMNLSVTLSHDKMQLNSIQITNNLQKQIHEAQERDEFINKKKKLIGQRGGENFDINKTEIIYIYIYIHTTHGLF